MFKLLLLAFFYVLTVYFTVYKIKNKTFACEPIRSRVGTVGQARRPVMYASCDWMIHVNL